MKKNFKKVIIFSITLVILFIITFLIIIIVNKRPTINVDVELSSLTNEEYNVLNKNDNVSYDNVKKLIIEVEVTNSPKCKVRVVKIPDLNKIDRIDYVRSYEMNYQEDNDLKDSQAKFIKDCTFNSTDLTISELKNIFINEKITVTIVNKSNKELKYSYSIGELLEASQEK